MGLLVYAGQEEAFTQAQQDRNDEDLGIAIVVGALLAYIPVTFAYYLIGTANGGAWGKRIANIRIVRERDGQKPGYGSALGRVLITWIFSAIPLVGNIVWLVDNLSMLWDGENQTWHDKVAGTVVVRAG